MHEASALCWCRALSFSCAQTPAWMTGVYCAIPISGACACMHVCCLCVCLQLLILWVSVMRSTLIESLHADRRWCLVYMHYQLRDPFGVAVPCQHHTWWFEYLCPVIKSQGLIFAESLDENIRYWDMYLRALGYACLRGLRRSFDMMICKSTSSTELRSPLMQTYKIFFPRLIYRTPSLLVTLASCGRCACATRVFCHVSGCVSAVCQWFIKSSMIDLSLSVTIIHIRHFEWGRPLLI